jgi:hypothetical protein
VSIVVDLWAVNLLCVIFGSKCGGLFVSNIGDVGFELC